MAAWENLERMPFVQISFLLVCYLMLAPTLVKCGGLRNGGSDWYWTTNVISQLYRAHVSYRLTLRD